jgi:hypothetical protein
MSCALLPPDYAADGGNAPPPYIVPHSEDPAFESTLQYNVNDAPPFKVTIGDPDVNRELEVRFCLRAGSATSDKYRLALTPIAVDPTPDRAADRKPILVESLDVCNQFASTPDTRFLYVIVAPNTLWVNPQNTCDLRSAEGYAYAFWRFTCDRPQ